MFTVLFVCTGNTCRSPMAERLLRHFVKEEGLSDQIKVISGGIFASVGEDMSANSRAVLAKHNIDASSFTATNLDEDNVHEAKLILPMTQSHASSILDLFPAAGGKVFTLGDFCKKGKDIADPFGRSVDEYEKCFAQLEELIKLALPQIISLMEEDKTA